MTKVKITNNRSAAYGVETVGGRYRFVPAGAERTVDAANVAALEFETGIEVEVIPGLEVVPESLRARVRAKSPKEDTFTGFLDRNVADITADLPKQSPDRLRAILAAEKAGKSRKTLVPAIKTELDSRSK